MNTEVKIFENQQLGKVRCWQSENGLVTFLASDVAKGLGYSSASAMTRTLDEDEKGMQNVHTPGGDQQMSVINESGFYHAALKARVEKAQQFRKWVTAVVLPQIRQTGGYIPIKEDEDDNELLSRAFIVARRTLEEKSKLLEAQAPKVEYCNEVLLSEDCVTTTQIAKQFGMSAIALNNKLHELGIQFKIARQWFLYAKYAKMGFAKERTAPYFDSKGQQRTAVTLVWTEVGKRFVSELIRNDYDLALTLKLIKD